MKKLFKLLVILMTTMSLNGLVSQNTIIEELNVLDASAASFYFGRQSLISDNAGNYHLFYISHSTSDYLLIKRTSSDGGISWSPAETISVYTPSSDSYRFLALSPSATIDEDGYFHILYEYRGLPIYLSSYPDYPPAHINYVTNKSGQWVTEVNVIDDNQVQTTQGNSSTVSYLSDNQIANYNGNQYYAGRDYAWWGTMYNIVYSDNSSGMWQAGSPLYTFDLGSIDTQILNASSIIKNGDSLYVLWYQSNDCRVEMKSFGGNDWSDLNVIYTDVYIPETHANPYGVGVGSYSDGYKSRITMFRTPEPDFNELLILSKSANQSWITDTLMLNETYSVISPTISGDTTCLFLINSAVENYSYIMKYLPDEGDISKSQLITSEMEEKFNNLITSNNTINPVAYMIYDEDANMYYLKIGRVDGVLSIEEPTLQEESTSILSQNYPNPFRNSTTINYKVVSSSNVKLSVYNMLGKLITTIVDGYKLPGNYSISLNAKDYSDGIYYYKISAEGHSQTKRMVILK